MCVNAGTVSGDGCADESVFTPDRMDQMLVARDSLLLLLWARVVAEETLPYQALGCLFPAQTAVA